MNGAVLVASLTGSAIEFVETAAIAYALAHAGSRREALWGTVSGLGAIALVAGLLGASLVRVPLRPMQFVVGALLLVFGFSWVLKSVRRQAAHGRAGWIRDPLGKIGAEAKKAPFSVLNFVVMAKSAALEGFEVAIVVVTLGLGSGAWGEALGGAAVALVATLLLVMALHGHLQKLPEVAVKLGAGIMLTSFGLFWLGEALRFPWPLGEASVVGLAVVVAGGALVAIPMVRKGTGG
ncbi:MAG: COG4280 domain-containing protein [Thermoplasmatota archaeon]